MRALKPCPFCGSSESNVVAIAEVIIDKRTNKPMKPYDHAVTCGVCYAKTDKCWSLARAITAWNGRDVGGD